MPKVSVVMPVYNVEQYLRNSIESVLDQTFQDFELILIDDGSPDGCPTICDDYAGKNSKVRVIHKENGGRSSARNTGVDAAKGKYLLFVDSDDTIQPNLLENVVPEAERTNADVTIFGIHTLVQRNGKTVSEKNGGHQPGYLKNHSEIEKAFVSLANDSMWNHPVDKLYLKSTIVENHVTSNAYYDRVCEDTVFLLDLFPFVNRICIVEGCYYNYFIRDHQSIVMKFIPERYEKYYGRFCKTKALMEAFPPQYRDEDYLYGLYCTFIIWAYEFMFHKDCRYTLRGRYRYIKDLFSIRKETPAFCKAAKIYIQNQSIYTNSSGTTQKVLIQILQNHYFRAWVFHITALMRRKIDA